ncbi:MAG: SH3 domain-containing protein [Candidatus Omnitrophica bacterium]|nr:SH3 domain-containing protein [Candidatus Omnitrophota bacterium]
MKRINVAFKNYDKITMNATRKEEYLLGKKLVLLLILFLSGCAFHEQVTIAPSLLPYTTREMKTAGFWIAQHPSPDKVILNSEEIRNFNKHITDELKLTKDITQWEKGYPGDELRMNLEKTFKDFVEKNYYQSGAQRASSAFYKDVEKDSNFGAIPEQISVRYGFIVHYADQRFFPTSQGLFAKQGDVDFDELQNSGLDMGTPVAVLHQSLDGKWFYVETELSGGWVESSHVALGNIGDVREFLSQDPFVIIAKSKADIYLDLDMNNHYDYVRMGVRLPVDGKPVGERIPIRLPTAGENQKLIFKNAYLKREDVSVGYLSYTPRTIIEQAFQLHNVPYGWGGMYGEQDCSRFLQEVFATVGIHFPRNSSEQAKIGQALAKFDLTTSSEEKLQSLRRALRGASILPLKGHIMLYLGEIEGRPFVIHATWGYREPQGAGQVVRVLNRVVVSDLFLGKGSKKGSLLERLVAVVEVK